MSPRYQLVGRAARYQAELLAGRIFPGPGGWPVGDDEIIRVRERVVSVPPSESKPVRVSKDLCVKRHAGKTKVNEEGHCRLCRRPSSERDVLGERKDAVRLMTRHHLVPRRWWRQHPRLAKLYRDVDANIVGLCGPCHDLVETNIEYRRMLRHVMTQAEVSFVIQVLGIDWLERRYPLRALTGS